MNKINSIRVKIFQGNTQDQTELLVNDWLADPRNAGSLITVKYTYIGTTCGVLIVYKLYPKDQHEDNAPR